MPGDSVHPPFMYEYLTAEHGRRLVEAADRRQAPSHPSGLRRVVGSALLAAGGRLAGIAPREAMAPATGPSRAVASAPRVPVGCHG